MATEASIQKKIINHLEKDGWFVIRLKVTNMSGMPDLLALKKDYIPFFIEVKKTKGGIISRLQDYMIRELRKLGFHAIVANSLEVVKEYGEKNW
jgi:Holliday junction resolvase